MAPLNGFDNIYFSHMQWSRRVEEWLKRENAAGETNPFLQGNADIIRQILTDSETGLRMVINIPPHALLNFLSEGRYRNIYENPVIGGNRPWPSDERIRVDSLLGFGDHAEDYYFGAVALGGTGVRFYGEFCMVLKPDRVEVETELFDRDSYDLLQPPLERDEQELKDVVKMLKGSWTHDVVDMLVMRMLPSLRGSQRLITSGTVSDMVLTDQEFIEVHLKKVIEPPHLEEVRQSPDEVALESRIRRRKFDGITPSMVELRWLKQRDDAIKALETHRIQYRIVTIHGRGYRWR